MVNRAPLIAERLSNGVSSATEAALPVAVTDDDDRVPIERAIVLARQKTSGMRPLAEDVEVLARHELHCSALGAPRLSRPRRPQLHRGDRACRREFRATAQLVAKARGFGPAKTRRHLVRTMPLGDKEPVGLSHRETAQNDGVQQREHGRRAADAQRERQDRDRGEDGTAAQQPEAEPDILKKVGEHGRTWRLARCNPHASKSLEINEKDLSNRPLSVVEFEHLLSVPARLGQRGQISIFSSFRRICGNEKSRSDPGQ